MAQADERQSIGRGTSARSRRRRRLLLGAGIMAGGYALLAVSPEMTTETVMLRIVAGFALLFVGLLVAFTPAIEGLFE